MLAKHCRSYNKAVQTAAREIAKRLRRESSELVYAAVVELRVLRPSRAGLLCGGLLSKLRVGLLSNDRVAPVAPVGL